jgi:hypothetical protein
MADYTVLSMGVYGFSSIETPTKARSVIFSPYLFRSTVRRKGRKIPPTEVPDQKK